MTRLPPAIEKDLEKLLIDNDSIVGYSIVPKEIDGFAVEIFEMNRCPRLFEPE